MPTTITTDEVIDILVDIIDSLDIDINGEHALLNWVVAKRYDLNIIDPDGLPVDMYIGDAAQAIADLVAYRIGQGCEELVDAAMWDMMTPTGWQFESHNVVLWTGHNGSTIEEIEWADRLTVWLGNERDYDMTRIGTAEIK